MSIIKVDYGEISGGGSELTPTSSNYDYVSTGGASKNYEIDLTKRIILTVVSKVSSYGGYVGYINKGVLTELEYSGSVIVVTLTGTTLNIKNNGGATAGLYIVTLD